MIEDNTAAGWLERLYARQAQQGGSTKIAFVDEAYRGFDRRNERPFYIAAAVVIDTRYMEEIREDLAAIAGSDYWHTTEAMRTADGPARAVEMLRYLADGKEETSILSTQSNISPTDRTLEQARWQCLSGLAIALASGTPEKSTCMIIEKRREAHEQAADSALIPDLIRADRVPRNFQLRQASPREDRLLWLPDVLAHAARRARALRLPEMYNEVRQYVNHVQPHLEPAAAVPETPAAPTPGASREDAARRTMQNLLADADPGAYGPRRSKTAKNAQRRGTSRTRGAAPKTPDLEAQPPEVSPPHTDWDLGT